MGQPESLLRAGTDEHARDSELSRFAAAYWGNRQALPVSRRDVPRLWRIRPPHASRFRRRETARRPNTRKWVPVCDHSVFLAVD